MQKRDKEREKDVAEVRIDKWKRSTNGWMHKRERDDVQGNTFWATEAQVVKGSILDSRYN